MRRQRSRRRQWPPALGRIITSAALLVMIVFLGFAAGKGLGMKEMGLSLPRKRSHHPTPLNVRAA